MAINNKDYKTYGPFKLWTIENFPFIEEDFDAITNYQLWCKIVENMKKLIENQTTLENSQKEVINAFNELEKYVNDYFENLDIQTEIDNKLDEMAESGELVDIIAQYLDLAGVLAYNTISELHNAENLSNGSIAYTLGQNTYNDGKGAFYKIRHVTSEDVVDGFNIVAIVSDNTIIGERLPNYYINNINDNLNTINTNLSLMLNKKIIFIGDSYAQGYNPDGNTTSWVNLIINKLNLTNSITKYYGGTGFVNTVDNKNFITLLDEITADNEVTDIIVAGGYNDMSHITDIYNGIVAFNNIAKTKFPNAKVHIGAIGWKQDSTALYNLAQVVKEYNLSAKKLNLHYLKNCEYSLHEYGLCFASDNVHPTQYGQDRIAENIIQAFLYGSCSVIYDYANILIKNLNSNVSAQTFTNSLGSTFNNGIVEVSQQNPSEILISTPFNLDGGGLDFKLGDIKLSDGVKSYIIGNNYKYNIGRLDIIFRTTDFQYYKTTGYFYIKNKELHIVIPPMINDARNNYLNVSINQIQIGSGSQFTSDGLMC